MICPYCVDGFVYKHVEVNEDLPEGSGVLSTRSTYDMKMPCPDCNGQRIIACCDGLIENA